MFDFAFKFESIANFSNPFDHRRHLGNIFTLYFAKTLFSCFLLLTNQTENVMNIETNEAVEQTIKVNFSTFS